MSLPGVPAHIATIDGPMVLGYISAYTLLGILIAQSYVYYTNFPKDRLPIRILVGTVLFIEFFIAGLMAHGAFITLGSGWGDLAVLITPLWSLMATPALSGMVSTLVHGFFCWRIWVLGCLWPVCALLMILSLFQWAMACYAGFKLLALGDIRLIHTLRVEICLWLAGSALIDTIIAIIMVTFLYRASKKTSFHATNTVISKLIKLTVETGMITALDAACDLIFFFCAPEDNNTHFIFFFMLAKLYSNSLLATLNSRVSSRISSQTVGNVALWDDEPPASLGVSSTNRHTSRTLMSGGGKGVHVTKTTERHPDAVQMVSLTTATDNDEYQAKSETDSKNPDLEAA